MKLFYHHTIRGAVRRGLAMLMLSMAFLLLVGIVPGHTQQIPFPTVQFGVGQTENPQQVAVSLQILFMLTILSLAPAILIMMTSFARIVVVLSFLRQAMGTQQMPPNQILIGLALFLSLFIMSPVWQQMNRQALQPYLSKQISQHEAIQRATAPLREFMLKQTREKDLGLFVDLAKLQQPESIADVPTYVVVPAFIISELKTAFQIGFLLFVPFLILDMVVASILLSMGMMMLPPILISLPFKLLLFVLVDGWHLVIGSLVQSFS